MTMEAVTIRIDKQLKDRLVELSRSSERSLSAQIRKILNEKYEENHD